MTKPAAPQKSGNRGYIASRPIMGDRTPQHVQNLVIRDYARRHGLDFKLSATELAVPGCFLMLNGVLNELHMVEGVILYSLFMLPGNQVERRGIYDRVMGAGCVLHAAVEDIRIADSKDVRRVEELWTLNQALRHAPRDLEPYRG